MRRLALTIAVLAGLGISNARAEFIVNFAQVGNNVIATGSGTLDLAGLSYLGTEGGLSDGVIPNSASIVLGSTAGKSDIYTGFTGPSSFGSLGLTTPSASAGDLVGLQYSTNYIALPAGFESGGSLSDSGTFANATFASLGLTPGTYAYTWSPPNVVDDSFVINIPATAVSEPATLALLAAPLAAFLFAQVRRRSFRR